MNKTLFLIIVGMSIIGMTISNSLAQAPGVTEDSITLGAIVDKSTFMVTAMKNQTDGMTAYFKKAQAEGIYKRKIKLITEDGAYDPAKHLAAGKLLLDRDKVFCLVNAVGTSPTLALNKLLEARKTPLLTVSSQSDRLADPFKKYIFCQMTSYFDQARIAVDYILSKDPKARIALISQDDDFGHEGREGLLAQCKKHGIEPAGIALYQRGARDLSAPVLKLKSLNPTHVINHAVAPYGAGVLKEAQKLGWKPKWVMMSGMIAANAITLAGAAMDFAGDVNGVMLNHQLDGQAPGAIEYREAMKKYLPEAAINETTTYWGYGFGKLIVEALKRAEASNDLTREGVIKAMESLKNFDTGVFSPITWSSTYHGAPRACLIVKREGKGFIPISNEWVEAK